MKESGDIYRVSNRTEYEQGISEDVSRGEQVMGALYLHLEFWLLTIRSLDNITSLHAMRFLPSLYREWSGSQAQWGSCSTRQELGQGWAVREKKNTVICFLYLSCRISLFRTTQDLRAPKFLTLSNIALSSLVTFSPITHNIVR